MRRALLLTAMIAGLTLAQARGAPTPKPDDDQSVTLSPVAVPIVANGRIANYVFVTVKVWLTPSANAAALRDKEPYFRDALVRAAHRPPFLGAAHDYDHVDEARLDALLYRDAVAIAGPGKIQRVQLLDQTPQHRLPAPR